MADPSQAHSYEQHHQHHHHHHHRNGSNKRPFPPGQWNDEHRPRQRRPFQQPQGNGAAQGEGELAERQGRPPENDRNAPRGRHSNQQGRQVRPRHRNPRHPHGAPGAPAAPSSTVPPSAPPCVVCGNDQARYRCPKCLARYCSVDCCRRHKEDAKDSNGGADGSGCRAPSSAGQEGTTAQTDPAGAKPSRYGMELEKARRLLGLPLVSPLAESSSSERRDDGNYDELEEGWKLTDQMVSAMNKCDWLKRELQDDDLRQLVKLVTTASNSVVRVPFSKSRRLKGQGDETEQDNVLDRLKMELPHFRRFLDKLLVVAGVLERPPRRGTASGDGALDTELNDWLEQSVATENEPLTLKPIPRLFRSIPRIGADEAAVNMRGSDSSESSTSSNESSSDDDTDSSESHSNQGEESDEE